MSKSGAVEATGVGVTRGEVTEGTPAPASGAPEPAPGMPDDPGMPAPVDEAALAPILEVLTEAGISREAIEVVISPVSADPYSGPYSGAARLEFTVPSPAIDALTVLMTTVNQTAADNGLALVQAGADYRVENCQALEDEAQIAAIDDARQRAERLADQLGVTTGATLLASDFGLFGDPYMGSGCNPFSELGMFTSYSGGPGSVSLTTPEFDPSRPTNVTLVKQIYLGLELT